MVVIQYSSGMVHTCMLTDNYIITNFNTLITKVTKPTQKKLVFRLPLSQLYYYEVSTGIVFKTERCWFLELFVHCQAVAQNGVHAC